MLLVSYIILREVKTVKWHSMITEEILAYLNSGQKGLSAEDATQRLSEHGPNQLESPTKPSPLKIFLGKFKDYMVLVLIFAALISYIAGETTNAYVILGIVCSRRHHRLSSRSTKRNGPWRRSGRWWLQKRMSSETAR